VADTDPSASRDAADWRVTMIDDDPSRPTRRRVLATLGTTAAAVGLAGCSDSGGEGSPTGGGGAGDGDGGGNGGSLGDSKGSVGTNAVAELEITGLESYVSDGSGMMANEGNFAVDVTVKNAGDQQTSIMEYDYSVSATGEDGEPIEMRISYGMTGGSEVAPGEAKTITISDSSEEDTPPVASYEVSIECGAFAEGAYCE
jgi:hypothetical protein